MNQKAAMTRRGTNPPSITAWALLPALFVGAACGSEMAGGDGSGLRVDVGQDGRMRIEGEDFDTQSGVRPVNSPTASGGVKVGYINSGDFIGFYGIDFFSGIQSMTARVSSATGGGTIQVRRDAPGGPILGSFMVSGTGGWNDFVDVSASGLGMLSGVHDLFLVFNGSSGYLLDLDTVTIQVSGSRPTTPEPTGDECNRTSECKSIYGPTADDCFNSRSSQSVCYCGGEPCFSLGSKPDPAPNPDPAPAPSCNDGDQNGNETDVDCGGSCPDCRDGESCNVASDCQSNRCASGVCMTPNTGGLHPDIVRVISVPGREPRPGWADSYSVGDRCYCDTTFDHDIGDIIVNTPNGRRTVRQVCSAIGKGPGRNGRPVYNDIQCGNGPANNAGDEDDCPGRVDIGRAGCGQIGPRWNFN